MMEGRRLSEASIQYTVACCEVCRGTYCFLKCSRHLLQPSNGFLLGLLLNPGPTDGNAMGQQPLQLICRTASICTRHALFTSALAYNTTEELGLQFTSALEWR